MVSKGTHFIIVNVSAENLSIYYHYKEDSLVLNNSDLETLIFCQPKEVETTHTNDAYISLTKQQGKSIFDLVQRRLLKIKLPFKTKNVFIVYLMIILLISADTFFSE